MRAAATSSALISVRLLVVGLCLAFLTACTSGSGVAVAPVNALDTGYHTYRHPSGAFSLRLPADWSVRDVSHDNTIQVEFSPPGNAGLPLSIYVINTGSVLDTGALLNTINKYQSVFNGNPDVYTELSRTAQGDGSWRLVGIRQTPIGSRELNTFVQADKSFLSAIEADLTDVQDARLSQLRTVINTFRVETAAAVGAASLNGASTGENTAAGSITFSGLLDYTDSTGGFNINGELTNQGTYAVEAVRVTALLYDTGGRLLAEQPDIVPNEIIPTGDRVPFRLQFRGGKPPQAVRYELQASARSAEYNAATYLPPENFIKGNEKATYNAQGFLSIGGDVVNGAQQPAKFIRVTITVYDEQDRVVGAESGFVERPELLPGEVSKYEVTFYQLAGNANRFVTKVEGRTR